MNLEVLGEYAVELQILRELMLERSKRFDQTDRAFFKAGLLSLGLLLGATLSRFFRRIRGLLAIVVVISWGYMIWRLFFAIED